MAERPPYRPWDLGRAALFGIVMGAVFSVMEQLGFQAFAGWTPLEIILFMVGRLSALGVLFAVVALVRNIIVRNRHRGKAS